MPLVSDKEWMILDAPKSKIHEKTEWIRDLSDHYADIVNQKNAIDYVNNTVLKLAKSFPQT